MQRTCVNLACGTSLVEGWLNLDYVPASPAVKKADLLKRLPLSDATADVLYCSHFLEHIPRQLVAGFLSECFRVLKSGGQVRLVMPDLDDICREYVRQRESGQHDRADFVILELLDQCVRTIPGGELGEYYGRVLRHGSAEMTDYVVARTGDGLGGARREVAPGPWPRLKEALRQPRRAKALFERGYCRLVTGLLPTAFREQNVSFVRLGERHAWVYDFHTLSRLLSGVGFEAIRKLSARQSDIVAFPVLLLDVTDEGNPRKGLESMYVEARKP